MAKQKPNRKKWKVVRTDAQVLAKTDRNTKRAIVGAAGALAALFVGGGLKMIASPILGYLLVGAGAVLGWFALVQMEWFQLLSRKSIQYLGYGVIVVASLILALCVPGGKPDVPKDINETVVTPQPVTTTVQDSPESRVAIIGEAHGPVHIDQSVDSTPEAQLSGILMPANEPDPVSVSEFHANIPPDALKVFLGHNVVWYTTTGHHPIIEVNGKDILSLKSTPDGLFVSASISREDGRQVATLTDNAFSINPNNYFQRKRPDPHELQIYDKSGVLVLKARYINERAVVVQGIFHMQGFPAFVVTETQICQGRGVSEGVAYGENNHVFYYSDTPPTKKQTKQ